MDWIFIGKAIALILVLGGGIIIYLAPRIVRKRGLDAHVQLTPEQEESFDEAGQQKYRFVQATLKIKLYGLLLAMPGFILVLLLFKQ